MTLAKGLGNGVPIGACLAAGPAAQVFHAGNHGSTFGGNPLACVAAHTTLSVITEERLLDNASRMGELIRSRLRERFAGLKQVRQIRGKGLMVGVDMDRPCASLVERGLERGMLINVTAGTVLRLLPPLIIDPDAAMQLVDGVAGLVQEFVAGTAALALD
jgi:acetylornithine/N-succinyldiaminopimelate aminotransferase